MQLENFEYTKEDIERKIKEYSEEARVYIKGELEGFEITEEEIHLIRNNYVQYKLFADVEMENLVADKRIFLKDFINSLKKNKLRIQEENQEKPKRMRVY